MEPGRQPRPRRSRVRPRAGAALRRSRTRWASRREPTPRSRQRPADDDDSAVSFKRTPFRIPTDVITNRDVDTHVVVIVGARSEPADPLVLL